MRIAVYGASGVMGSRIAAEAVARDHAVTAIRRTPDSEVPEGTTPRAGDASDADDVARVAAEHDVIVCALAPSRTGGRHVVFLQTLATLAENVGSRRLVVVGGSGSLLVATGLRLLDTPQYPLPARPEAITQAAALELLEDTGALMDWVYVSPAPVTTPGVRTGTYRLGRDTYIGDAISAEDYAVAVVDEIETPRHRRERFTVAT